MARETGRHAIAFAAAAARSGRNWAPRLVALGALVYAITVPAVPAHAEIPQWYGCLSEKQSNETVEKYAALLSPAEGATVVAGTPVTFFARSSSETPMTFMIASSPALLSSPDIDGGLGTLLPPGYKTELLPSEDKAEYWLTSTKASAIPRTIYWTASFTRNLRSCDEPPVTFTLPPRTLTVVPSPAEEQAAARKKQEAAAAARKKREEEVAAAATASVSPDGSTITVQSTGAALLKLTCTGTSTCAGKLTLTTKSPANKGKKTKAKTETIGTAAFSIPAAKTATVDVTLDGAGRALLSAAHGRLGATLTVLKSSPAPARTLSESVHLVRTRAHGKAKK
jgi:hypothetical protein